MIADSNVQSVKPFLRWAGSKRWLVPHIQPYIPHKFKTYYEPFLGSGTIFFKYIENHPAHLSDTIETLIDCYRGVQMFPREVAELAHSWNADEQTYYEIRSTKYQLGTAESAARFLYLNRFCFNGLYRENAKGDFNVPFGRPKNPSMTAYTELTSCSDRLRVDTTLAVSDFAVALSECQEGDFAYLDPPYLAGHRLNGFVDYNARIFSWEDQERLSVVFKELDARGTYVILTNADHESVRALYDDYRSISVSRFSSMAGNKMKRGISTELMILGRRVAAEALAG
jgi:DNA adenine methylase